MAKFPKLAQTGHTRKRAAKKSTGKAAGKAKSPTKAKTKAGKKKTVMRQPPLGGMEQVRHVVLDRYCETVGDAKEEIKAQTENVDADIQSALDYMVKNNVTSYHHHGIEFVLRPGSYKLSVRKHREMTAQMTDEGPELAGADNDRDAGGDE